MRVLDTLFEFLAMSDPIHLMEPKAKGAWMFKPFTD